MTQYNPCIEASRLHGLPDCYKVKLRSSGYRLVYQVIDHEVLVFVVAVDKRERSAVYDKDRLCTKSPEPDLKGLKSYQ